MTGNERLTSGGAGKRDKYRDVQAENIQAVAEHRLIDSDDSFAHGVQLR